MKNILTIVSAGLCMTFGAHAQPTLTAASSNPLPGENFGVIKTQDTSIAAGATGPSVTWDLATIKSYDTSRISFSDCTSASHCDSFPDADIFLSSIFTQATYYVANSTEFSATGVWTGLSRAHYSDRHSLLKYPVNYSDTLSDAHEYTYPGHFIRGIDTFTADAWGTLVLPSGTHTNVMRLHRIANATDSTASTVTRSRYHQHIWYKPGFHWPLLIVAFSIVDGEYVSATASYVVGLPPTTSVANTFVKTEEITISPIPATDVLHINFNTSLAGTAEATLTDMAGRTMSTHNYILHSGTNNLNYDVASLPVGMYLLRINTATEHYVQKITVQR